MKQLFELFSGERFAGDGFYWVVCEEDEGGEHGGNTLVARISENASDEQIMKALVAGPTDKYNSYADVLVLVTFLIALPKSGIGPVKNL